MKTLHYVEQAEVSVPRVEILAPIGQPVQIQNCPDKQGTIFHYHKLDCLIPEALFDPLLMKLRIGQTYALYRIECDPKEDATFHLYYADVRLLEPCAPPWRVALPPLARLPLCDIFTGRQEWNVSPELVLRARKEDATMHLSLLVTKTGLSVEQSFPITMTADRALRRMSAQRIGIQFP